MFRNCKKLSLMFVAATAMVTMTSCAKEETGFSESDLLGKWTFSFESPMRGKALEVFDNNEAKLDSYIYSWSFDGTTFMGYAGTQDLFLQLDFDVVSMTDTSMTIDGEFIQTAKNNARSSIDISGVLAKVHTTTPSGN